MLHLRVPIQQLRNKPIFNLCHFISLLLIQSWNTVQSVPPVHCAAQIECIPDWRVGATPIKIITFLCFASLVGRNADCTIHESRMAPSVHNGLHPTCNPKVLLVLQGTKHSHSHATATSAFRPSSKGHALCGTLRSSVAPLPAHPHRCNELLVAAPLRPCAQAWSASWTAWHRHTARRSYAPRPWPRCVPSSPLWGQSHLGCQCPRTSRPDILAPQAVWTLLLPMMSLWPFAPRPAGDVGKFQGFNVRWCFGLLSHGFMTLVLHYTDVATCELNHIALVLGGLFTAMMM